MGITKQSLVKSVKCKLLGFTFGEVKLSKYVFKTWMLGQNINKLFCCAI